MRAARDDRRVTDDRREHVRVDFNTKAIVLARHNAGVALAIDSISVGGARLIGEITVQVGEHVQILFEIEGHPLDVKAEVVRAEQIDMATDHIAVRFLKLAADTSELLRALVQRHLDVAVEKLAADEA